MYSFLAVLGVVLWIFLALWPAMMAKKKGYSFVLFFIISIFISWLLGLIIVLFLSDKNETAESREASAAAEKALDIEENQ